MGEKAAITKSIFQREFLSVLIIVVNAFSWYFPLYILFQNALEQFQLDSTLLLTAFGIQAVAAIGFAIIGTTLLKKFPRRDLFLTVWMFIGIIVSVLLITLETFNVAYLLSVSFLSGFSLGLGFPSCLAYFGDHTKVENRGLLAGITFFASGLAILLIGLIINFSTLVTGALILAAWRGIGLLLFLLVKSKKDYPQEKQFEAPYKAVLFDKSFLLYFIPWTLFCAVNFLGVPIEINLFGEELGSLMPIGEYGVGGFVALIGGWFADTVGRKRIIIVGFVMLGIGFAVLGLFPGDVLSWYLYIIVDGIAWGIFSLMFYLVIWSELAGNRTKEKYYMLGVLPFLTASYIQILFTPFAGSVEASSAFSLASFFLFIAVLPLLYAPETMPEKKIELKRLQKFAEDAKKAKEKYERKMEK
ncbi:MAG: MFS transporter [Candidatus Bathyarchaeota archaeon]|nr:MFS transporter [Candidatus Bathyarchaeum sp.]